MAEKSHILHQQQEKVSEFYRQLLSGAPFVYTLPGKKDGFFAKLAPSFDVARDILLKANDQNKNVYYIPNTVFSLSHKIGTDEQGNAIYEIKELEEYSPTVDYSICDNNVSAPNAVWIDIDNGPLPEDFPLEPTVIASRQDKKGHHVYWFITETDDFDLWRDTMETLIKYYHSDTSINNPGRWMRLPYTAVRKNKPHKGLHYEIVHADYTNRYAVENVRINHRWENSPQYKKAIEELPPVEEGGRHDHLKTLICSLFCQGHTKSVIKEKVLLEFPRLSYTGDRDFEKEADKIIEWRDSIRKQHENIEVFPPNQEGLSERVARYLPSGRIIYNINSASWFVFNGKRWIDNIVKPLSTVSRIIKDKYPLETEKLSSAQLTEKGREKVYGRCVQQQNSMLNANYITAALDFLKDKKGFAAAEEDTAGRFPMMNSRHSLINFKNTAFDLDTFKPIPFDYAHYSTYSCNTDYKPEALCPIWEKFLDQIFEGNAELIQWVQCFLGSALKGTTGDRIFPIFYGTGANGKSTLINVMMHILGDYAGVCFTQDLASREGNTNRFALSDFPGKRFIVANESEQNARLNMSLVKVLTGGDVTECERKHRSKFKFVPTFKPVLITNHKPIITHVDKATRDRIKLIPFSFSVPEAQQDRELTDKLKLESSGVLNWLIAGAKMWSESGRVLPSCSIVDAASREYLDDEDTFVQWFEDRCEQVEDPKDADSIMSLLEDYRGYTNNLRFRKKSLKLLLVQHDIPTAEDPKNRDRDIYLLRIRENALDQSEGGVF